MDDVRLTATNPADSSIVPVACNDKGELLLEEPIAGPEGPPGEDGTPGAPGAEGPQGPEGPEGPPGEDGKDGKDGKDGIDGEDGKDGIDGIPLPPDPYEGALLGWLNNGLAWIGTPPVPIPSNVFGPITYWDPVSSILRVEGEIPAEIGNGVYLYQCDREGRKYTEGWNVSQEWSNAQLFAPTLNTGSLTTLFDGGLDTGINAASGNTPTDNPVRVTFGSVVNYSSTVKCYGLDGQLQAQINDEAWVRGDSYTEVVVVQGRAGSINSIAFTEVRARAGYDFQGVEVDGNLLVNESLSLNLRVNQVFDGQIIGAPNVGKDFTVGQYLLIPAQRVAPWVLYEGDPTSRIDYLRSKRD